MEVYYIEAEIFENIMDRIENLSTHVDHLCKKTEEKKLGEWMDNQDVCLRLNMSPRTLQTLRDTGKLAYSQIQHKIYYKAGCRETGDLCRPKTQGENIERKKKNG